MTETPPSTDFLAHLAAFDCHMQDLKLILRKFEEIQFPEHEGVDDDETLILPIFPDITRKSFIVTLLIALDDELKTYCEILRYATKHELRWNDLRGSALERFITYSEKVCSLRAVSDDSTEQLLKGLIEVRNCIVHNNSGIDGFSKSHAIVRFAERIHGMEISEGYITLEITACIACADIVHKFMERAYYAALDLFPPPFRVRMIGRKAI